MTYHVPVVLFAYARPDHLRRTLACLRQDRVPTLCVYSDGPRGRADWAAVREVRDLLHAVDWCDIELRERNVNLGLGRSILTGVSDVLRRHEAAIVFEDDLVFVPGTYEYLRAALEHYRDDAQVMSVTGWAHPSVTPIDVGTQPWFDCRAESWSWGTWARAWNGMQADAKTLVRRCEAEGVDVYRAGADLREMADRELKQNIWAVRFAYWHLLNGGVCLRPPWSLVNHAGFDEAGTNAAGAYRWDQPSLRPCPPLPTQWPAPVEHPASSALDQAVYGPRPGHWGSSARMAGAKTLQMATKGRDLGRRLCGRSADPRRLKRELGVMSDGVPHMLRRVQMLRTAIRRLGSEPRPDEQPLLLLGALLADRVRAKQSIDSFRDVEFRVFSQWGDDGIIQWLVAKLEMPSTFVEFGVQDYRESNTRFLMMHDNWAGLVMDGSAENVARIIDSEYFWQYSLVAKAAFIDCANVNDLVGSADLGYEIGILHIDLDGNDYWIWKTLESVLPVVVIMEYNALFGLERAITVPYDAGFRRTAAHYSNLYWGASLRALCLLAREKGYAFVGCNSGGNNAYFVRRDRLSGGLRESSVEDGFIDARFRESRDRDGRYTLLSGAERLDAIRGMPVVNVANGATESL